MFDIYTKFKDLVEFSCPDGNEEQLMKYFIGKGIFPKDVKADGVGNYYIKIGESETIFTSHLDTYGKFKGKVEYSEESLRGDKYIYASGISILGADDKAGTALMLYMIENKIPGLYYFFYGEETGCNGSKKAVESFDFSAYKRVVSFDRRGYTSVITKMKSVETCSEEFATVLCDALGMDYIPDPTGGGTDANSFKMIVPECTNISVGYMGEHTANERQNITFLRKLSLKLIRIKWEELPVVRVIPDVSKMSRNQKRKMLGGGKSNHNTHVASLSNERYNNFKDLGRLKNNSQFHDNTKKQRTDFSVIYGNHKHRDHEFDKLNERPTHEEWNFLQNFYNDNTIEMNVAISNFADKIKKVL